MLTEGATEIILIIDVFIAAAEVSGLSSLEMV